jgi:UDP-N-acetylglucosamine 4,6-dehydratase/5-epimerase
MKNNNAPKMDFLKNKTILVTGGTGSFGKSFIIHLLKYSKAKKIIIFSRDELKQSIFQKEETDPRLRFFLGDIRDLQRLERAFHGVDIIIHAAALKQVPTLEYNPFEAVKTNVIGTQNVIDAAIDQGVEKVLLISTDKAAQPVNLYGSTKLCAEKLMISGNSYGTKKTRFSCVRYGNVVGSRGSIVEILLKNPNQDTVYITHEEMTRFWINMDQTFKLVLFALENMEGGEIFVPKIPSMKLTDLFDALVPNAIKKFTGIRPGEKVHEILLTTEESRHALELKDYFVILPQNEQIFNTKKRFQKLIKMGKKIPKEFNYTSDTNKHWLTKEQFRQMITGK